MRQFGSSGATGKSPTTAVWRRSNKVGITPSFRTTPLTSLRYYFWPYNEDFVPKGVTTSGFQSSASPSVRQRVLREYAFSPLFGARVPCCTLGTMRSAREMMILKKDIQLLLCEILHLQEGSVSLGPLVQTRDMMMFKHDAPLSPRLGDDRRSNKHAYGRKPIVARTLMDVFLPEDVALGDVLALGRLVQEKLQDATQKKNSLLSRNNEGGIRDTSASSVGSSCSSSGGGGEENPVWVLAERMGISHCDVPPLDESGFVFDAVGGTPLDAEEVERILQRWHERGC